jgi:hypothetical protein|tara:strand:- start:1488 stop:2597 length:1110 start_codon:yes stop_codon:yes gene_type:complete
MPTQVQFRRGTTSQNNSFTGAVGEISIDTDLDTIRVHDGSTAGGYRLAKYSELTTGDIEGVTAGTGLSGGGTSGTVSLALSHLGLESLSDPDGDRIAFWDDSAGAFQWLAIGSNISISGTTISSTDTNTTYTAGTGLSLSSTEFAIDLTGGTGVTISGSTISIGQAVGTSDNVTFGNLTLSGNLTVNGTTSTVATTNTVVSDTLLELGNGTSGTPANDAGIVIERGSSDNAFIGFDESADKFIVGTGSFTGASTGNLTISTGTLVAALEGDVTGNVSGNAGTATALATGRTISLGGDLSGSASFDGTANITITATVAANSVALGTDTSGSYVESLVAGNGISLANNSGEGATPTITGLAVYDSGGSLLN